MRDELLPMARKMDRNLDVELHKLGSETKEMRDMLKPNSVDLAFTSPPYFLQEKYSDDLTQSCVRYGDQESWLNEFMGQTLDNCAYCLKARCDFGYQHREREQLQGFVAGRFSCSGDAQRL
jgi:hypothetical protein